MKKILSILLCVTLIISMLSSLTIIASADYSLSVNNDVTVEGNTDGKFSKWISFTPKNSDKYSIKIELDGDFFFGYLEAILCDSSKEMLTADVNLTDTGMYVIEADLVAGEKYYLQVFGEGIDTFTVSVDNIKTITNLEIEKYPEKLTYYEGAEMFDIYGLVIKAAFEDGTTESYYYDYNWFDIGPGGNLIQIYNNENPETGELSEYEIVCGGKSVGFSFTKLETPIESVTVNSNPSRVYYYGDYEFGYLYTDGYDFYPTDFNGLNFTINYKDGTTKTYTDADFNEYQDMIDNEYAFVSTNYEDVKVGEVPVYVTYMGYTFTFNVKMEESPFSDIKIVKDPYTATVEDDFHPDFVGMNIELEYKDGTKKLVVVDENNLVYDYVEVRVSDDTLEAPIFIDFLEGYDNVAISCAGTYVEYTGLTVTDNIQIDSFDLGNVSLDPSTMEITLHYLEGDSEILNIEKVLTIDSYSEEEIGCTYEWYKLYTNKGILDCGIWEYSENGVILSHEVVILNDYITIDYTANDSLGDVDGDGNITAADALFALKHAAKLDLLDDEAAVNADVVADGTIDSNDALFILKYAADLIDSF